MIGAGAVRETMSTQPATSVKLSVSVEDLAASLRAMSEEDREWFIENLLAATSPEYLKSIQEAREDYRQGRTVSAADLFGQPR